MNKIQLFAFVIASCLAVIVCLCFTIGSDSGAAPIELESRVNPNNAPAAGLMMLPGVGAVRAQAIINYREQFRQNGSGDLAFRDCNDLDNVKGVGPATARGMCEYLKFK
jgi:competence protein ComEA